MRMLVHRTKEDLDKFQLTQLATTTQNKSNICWIPFGNMTIKVNWDATVIEGIKKWAL